MRPSGPEPLSPSRPPPRSRVGSCPAGPCWPAAERRPPILRWGDPLFAGSPAFNPKRADAKAQELRFGYNNDYLDILVDPRGRRGLLSCNHEYTNRPIMFPPTTGADEEAGATTFLC